ncbi:MAG: TetR family transcriptional regulator C-terminal domain-containing protein [Stappiaceae bacterium]
MSDVLNNTSENPEKKPTRIQAENQRKIGEAALETFAEFGFRGATIDVIATRAGMSKPNMLYYYKSKKDIYLAVLEQTLKDWLTPLVELDPAGDPQEEISSYIRRKLELSRQHPKASRLFAQEILNGAPHIQPVLSGSLKELVERKCAVIQGWIDEGKMARVDPVHLVFMIWATTQHYADFQVQIEAVMGRAGAGPTIAKEAEKTLMSVFISGLFSGDT